MHFCERARLSSALDLSDFKEAAVLMFAFKRSLTLLFAGIQKQAMIGQQIASYSLIKNKLDRLLSRLCFQAFFKRFITLICLVFFV